MSSHTGYLLIADISGYTAFLISSEQNHANQILKSLMTTLVESVSDPLQFGGMSGDAVLAYSKDQPFPTGETFLSICENLYNNFTIKRRNIIANTTCDCRACVNVANLDLKILGHHGQYEEMHIGQMKEISGAEVILVHRMAKTDVKQVTGIQSYALFSDASIKAMGIDSKLVPYTQTIEHFGEVGMQVYDLAEAWDQFRANQKRQFLEESDGVFTHHAHFDASQAVVWEALVEPKLKQQWMQDIKTVTVEREVGRIGPGSGYHCAHEMADFRYAVTDWQPCEYFSTVMRDPGNEALSMQETYAFTTTENGTDLRYTMGPMLDQDGQRHLVEEGNAIEFLKGFWQASFANLAEMLKVH
ncbi:MAG: hypothetical protein ACI8P9_003065 [Parasphingorhabdus sp.]|jgi:uncharacterized protein YndB with AHSA1/START domain